MIIIGAGLAGLSTGCYAQLNGYESKIFEYHRKAGGVAAVVRSVEDAERAVAAEDYAGDCA